MMPRVVDNQLEVFRTDQFLKDFAQGVQIKYGNIPHGKDKERHDAFKKDCEQRHMSITVAVHGINLDLVLSSIQEQSNNEMVFESEFIMNGVCIRLKGRINKQTLIGQAHAEFNAERAELEHQQALSIAQYAQRLASIRRMIE